MNYLQGKYIQMTDKLEICLTGLPGLPDTVFEITEIESLKLEQVKNVTIPAGVAKLDSLQEFSLIYCPAKLQLLALNHLKEHLKVLRLTFESSEEIPMWMYTLHCLEELYLTGPLTNEVSKTGNLESLRDLRVKLQAFSTLKKLTNLASLELSGCDLERIPSAVFSLNNLQELDLKENKLCTVEEILSLQHCRRLVTLRLWHNKITYIPDHITKLHTLETLDISFNKLKKLPSRLFYCTRLRHLDISHNQITSIPSEVNILPGLQFFSDVSEHEESSMYGKYDFFSGVFWT
uniref:Leucine rich repeat containing 8 VRAC subunit C n=1 Tax=Xiphophorus couchianus TaxID=32473 RepID=A0A3B5M1R1_9TELE